MSLTSNLSPHPRGLSDQASKYSSDCKNKDVLSPLLSVTIQPPKASAPSAPQASSPSSGRNASEWGQPDLASPQRILGHTLSDLADPWPYTLLTYWIGHS